MILLVIEYISLAVALLLFVFLVVDIRTTDKAIERFAQREVDKLMTVATEDES